MVNNSDCQRELLRRVLKEHRSHWSLKNFAEEQWVSNLGETRRHGYHIGEFLSNGRIFQMKPITFVKICFRLWLLQAEEHLYSDISIVLGNKKLKKFKLKGFSEIYKKNLRVILRSHIDSKVTDCSDCNRVAGGRSEDLSDLPDLIDSNNNIDNE